METPGQRQPPFLLKHLTLTDYRGFDVLDAEWTDFNVLLGVNGSGKTTILQAIATSLSRFTSRLISGKTGGIKIGEWDIRNQANSCAIASNSLYYDDEYGIRTIRARRGRALSAHLSTAPEAQGSRSYSVLADRFREILSGDAKAAVPVIALYPVNRAAIDIPLKIRKRHTFDQVEAYDGAFQNQRNFRTFFEWFRLREDIENEERISNSRFRDPQLQAVRKAVEDLMPGYERLRVRRSPLRMTMEKHGEELVVNQLSDGEKAIISLAGDLAKRLAVANPAAKSPLAGVGCVLVDEIDLHIHPAWQRHLVQCLPQVFPNLQFFLTTHSPVIAGIVRPQHLFVLDGGRVLNAEAYGKEVNAILSEIFDTPPRPDSIQKEIDRLFELIADESSSEASQLLANLSEQISSGDPQLVKARTLLKRFRHT